MSDTPNPESIISEWDEHDQNPAAYVARQLYRELTAAQTELKNNKELHDRLLNEYAHVDTEVRKLALAAGIPQDAIDGDSYSVPGIEELVELIVQILTAAQAEIDRLKAGGCARDQRTTQFCGEALKLQEENAKLQERIARLEEAGDRMAAAWDKEWLTQADAEAIIDDWYEAKDTQ